MPELREFFNTEHYEAAKIVAKEIVENVTVWRDMLPLISIGYFNEWLPADAKIDDKVNASKFAEEIRWRLLDNLLGRWKTAQRRQCIHDEIDKCVEKISKRLRRIGIFPNDEEGIKQSIKSYYLRQLDELELKKII